MLELNVNGTTLKLDDKQIAAFLKIASLLIQLQTPEQVKQHLPTLTFAGLPELYNIVNRVSRKDVEAIKKACETHNDTQCQIFFYVQIFGAAQHNITLQTGADKPNKPRNPLAWEIEYLLNSIRKYKTPLLQLSHKLHPPSTSIPLVSLSTPTTPEATEEPLFTQQPRLDETGTCHCTIL